MAAAALLEDTFDRVSATVPEGWRVELIEGEIHVRPPVDSEHEEIISELTGQVRDHRKDLTRFTNIGLRIPGASMSGKVIPDVVIVPKRSYPFEVEYYDPSPVVLVAEVTSRSTGDRDRGAKLRGYARAGIPAYLLIDRAAGIVTLYTQPRGERYAIRAEVEISQVITLPEPLGFDLDTSEF
ncbi:Uma2 family endonuclease [Streptomyces sp. NBC_01537]|uniref:Uma2 family endonuclease n=1 Tax=Streptomyces sp. NBC_01537 TaxID=2903896 RepID=UPI003870D105